MSIMVAEKEKRSQPLKLDEQEHKRLDQGGKIARKLLNLGNSKLNSILGVEELDFGFEGRFTRVTKHTEATGEVALDIIDENSKAKSRVDVSRTEISILNQDGELDGRGVTFYNGGGIRAKYIPADFDEVTQTYTLSEDAVSKLVRDAESETKALAGSMAVKAMTLDSNFFIEATLIKNGKHDLLKKFRKEAPGGGGKGEDIIYVDKRLRSRDLTPKEQIEAGKKLNRITFESLKVWGKELTKKGALLTSITRAAGDQNTTFTVDIDSTKYSGMDAVVMGHKEGLKEAGMEEETPKAIASGKLNEGHFEPRDESTGVGSVYAVEATAERFGIKLNGEQAFVRGCGSAAQGMSAEFRKLGVRITAIAAESAIITKEDGFTEEDQKSLFDFVVNEKEGTAQQWAKLHEDEGVKVDFEADYSNGRNDWPDQLRTAVFNYWDKKQPKIIVEAATQETIDEEAVDHLPKDCIVLETANLVTTPEAAEKMKGIEIYRIPAPLANRGGIFGSEYERARDVLQYDFSREDVFSALKQVQIRDVNRMFDIIEISADNEIYLTPEEAFYGLAVTNAQKLYNYYKALPLVA